MTRTDQSWREAFVLELRLRDVDGADIGDAVAVVEAHCAESGEHPEEAFGDPVAYATETAVARPSPAAAGLDTRQALGIIGSLVGVVLAPLAASAWFEGRGVPVTVGYLVTVAIVLLIGVVLVLRPTAALRFLVDRRLPGLVLVALTPLVVLVLINLLLPQEAFSVTWGVPAVVSVAALLLSVVGAWPGRHGDPLRDPVTGASQGPSPVLAAATVLSAPILAALAVGLTYVVHSA